jgi:hypothetical protein
MREGFQVLQALGYPPTPRALRLFTWLPEPLMVSILQRRLRDPLMEVALAKHAGAARDEVKHLVNEFLPLVRLTNVPTPAIRRLYPYLAEDASLMPAGNSEIPLDWRSAQAAMVAAGGLLAGLLVVSALVGRRLTRPRKSDG